MEAPQWMSENAKRGVEWYEAGFAGDGVQPQTVREAREMAAGTVSEEKAVRMAAWFARHMGDLNGVPQDQDPPTPGMVAHALWGGWPREESQKAMLWARENSPKSLKAPGDAAVITDLDDTLVAGTEPNETVLAWLLAARASGYQVIIVSGRQDTRLEETRAWLNEYEVPHDAVYLSDFPAGPNAATAFKLYKAEKLLEEGLEIEAWLDDNGDVREGLERLGIDAYAPTRLPGLEDSEDNQPTEDDPDNNQPNDMSQTPKSGTDYEGNTMQFKTYSATLTTDSANGTVEAVVSVFNNTDLVNDRVMPGAFAKSLEDYATTGRTIPFVWSHDYDTPESYIGKVVDAKETSEGLLVKAELFDTPRAQVVRELLVNRVVSEFSFAYDVVHQAKAADGVNELTQLNLLECGPTLRGANPMTRLIDAKAAKVEDVPEAELETKDAPELPNIKAGRTLSSKNEATLTEAHDLLNQAAEALKAVLSSVQQQSTEEAKSEELPELEAKAEEPTVTDPSTMLALLKLIELDN